MHILDLTDAEHVLVASAFFAFGADANFSRICRTTGGSSEDDDDLTNSPASFR